ncbi:MAG: hypothetical protein EPO40_02650 [Myxococcaceae bacterium]|nr:MAG: hypothetical protein EPO40_02650 [Myxococcaceae bacterium]
MAPCRGGACPSGQSCCADVCVDARTSTNICGGCGVVGPPVAHGSVGCIASACGVAACDPGFADCDGGASTGCETDVATDPAQCGACGVRFGPQQACVGGVCTSAMRCPAVPCGSGQSCCGAGFADCNGGLADGCETALDSPTNCGACGLVCPRGGACVNGACTPGGCNGGAPYAPGRTGTYLLRDGLR